MWACECINPNLWLIRGCATPPPPQFVLAWDCLGLALLMCGGVPGDCLGPWGPWVPSARDPFEAPSKLRENMFFIIYLKIISYYSVGQAIQLLWRVGWIWGPCGLPPLRDCFLHFFDKDFNQETDALCDGTFSENATFQKMISSFPFVSFHFPLVSFNFPLASFS